MRRSAGGWGGRDVRGENTTVGREKKNCSILFENYLLQHTLSYGRFFHFAETLVQRQIVSNAVFPSGGRVLVIREMVDDPSVDVFHRQRFDRRVLDGHEDQTRKRVRRFGFRVHL